MDTPTPVGARVQVWADGGKRLGDGTCLGVVTLYSIVKPNGTMHTLDNVEERPNDELVDSVEGELYMDEGNTKIQLDSGRIVYSCQVWWSVYPGQFG